MQYMCLLFFIALLGSASASKLSTECPVDELQGHDYIECQNPFDLDADSDVNARSENTTCLISTSDTFQYIICKGGTWEDTSLTIYKDLRRAHQRRTFATHHKRIKRGFWSSVGHFFSGLARGVVCVLSLFTACNTFGGRSGPPQDRTKPTIYNCPPPIYATAKPFQTYAVVTWNEPTAHDDRDGDITPVRHGSGPHYSFSEERSPYYIKYTAKDNSGNSATCTVKITITVIRCPKLDRVANGYYICHPSTGYVLSTFCRFGCYEGFELEGASHVTCTEQKMWSSYPPKCKPLTCPVLPAIVGASPSCTNDNFFRSICSFNCKVGYDMPPHVSKTAVCQNDKTWRKHGEPRCKDIEAPTFETCPSVIIRGTDVGNPKGKLIWKEPTLTDNSGQPITAIQSPKSVKLGSYQSAGTYTITYSAEDAEGNHARDCVFKVIIRDSRCPRLYPTPYMQISCPFGYRTGSICNISCDPGKVIVGKTDVKCDETNGGLLGAWSWGRQRSFCNITNTCVQLKPPKNGALACDNWLGGELCQYQCQNNYDSFTDWKKLTVCQKSGTWSPHIDPFNCVKQYTGRRQQTSHVKINAEYFFSGDCTNDTTKTEIRQNFMTVLNSGSWSVACLAEPNCHVGNVQVICGSSDQSRRRRDVQQSKKEQAYVENMLSTIIVETQITIESSANESFVDIQAKYASIITTIKLSLSAVVKDESLASFNTTFSQLKTNGLTLDCPGGSVQATNSFSCIPCPEGTHFDNDSMKCRPCKKSTYQDKLGQLNCKKCPLATTTHSTGSTAYSDCEDACEPGSFSSDGIVPCSLCEVGYYQNKYGQTVCIRCPGAQSTVSIGSADISNCNEFDIELPGSTIKRISLQPHNEIQLDNFFISFWVRTSNVSSMALNVSLLDSYGTIVLKIYGLKQLQIGHTSGLDTNITLVDERWHKVTISLQRCVLAVGLDGQDTHQSTLSHGCGSTLTFNEILIDAGEEYGGGISQLNIVTEFYDEIASGKRCFHSDIADILSWHEFGGANMSGAFITAPSDCDDFDNCLSSPCQHGSCKDGINSFVCECNNGFTGIQCETNIDDCFANVCMNNATCIDGVMSYTCTCPRNKTGKYCEIEMVSGEWGIWSNWSECSTTCGGGNRTRFRLCDSPAPDNGGNECEGDSTDYTHCNNTDCPVCSTREAPGNGTLSCTNETGSLNCTISCNHGFDFDIEPLEYYFCGPETFYEWNYQTAINPLHRLPKCTAISMPSRLSVHYNAQYKDFYCTGNLKETATNVINSNIMTVLKSLPCIRSQICFLDGVHILHCDGLKRQKRAHTTVGIQLTLSTQPNEGTGTHSLDSLQDAFKLIQAAADNGEFTVNIQGDDYELDRNQTDVSGQVLCPPGMTRVLFYCVPCGEGSYLHTDYCKMCEIGFYQDKEGQTFCYECPKDRTTLGIGSSAIEDCSVHRYVEPNGIEMTALALGCTFGVAAIFVITVFIYRRKRTLQRKLRLIQPQKSNSSSTVSSTPFAVAPAEELVIDKSTNSIESKLARISHGYKEVELTSLKMFGPGMMDPPHRMTCVREKLQESLNHASRNGSDFKTVKTSCEGDDVTICSAMGIKIEERPSSRETDISI